MSVTGGITILDKNTFLRGNAAARGGAVMYVQKCIDIGSFVGKWHHQLIGILPCLSDWQGYMALH